ncbi:MAG: cupin domain-containing protein [Chlorobiaceae bacterium]|nr:cupin domain-containing protein [Chlorobiaceae bacterium]
MQKAEFWIRQLGLERHPEGGWYKETYRSSNSYDFGDRTPFGSPRSFATSIHYLLEKGDRSRLHRINSDELWYFHAGAPLEVHLFPETGVPSSFTLGDQPDRGQVLHDWVPAGCRFGARMLKNAAGGTFSLVSCVVAPGFDFRDFSFSDRIQLLGQFPDHEPIITALT